MNAAASAPPLGAGTYFLSLTVENVRCFGPAQTLDLSDGQGRPAPWTVILGENGLGKTTLLTCLASIATAKDDDQHRWNWFDRFQLIRSLKKEATVRTVLATSRSDRPQQQIGVSLRESSVEIAGSPNLVTLHYGASRRMPQMGSLAENHDGRSIFLDHDVALRDPEGWLLRADYNARLHGPDAKRFSTFAQRVQDALVNVLPEVAEIRIQPSDERGGSPRVEARTPDGWMPLRRLGFGYQSQIAWLVDFASRMFERYPDSPDPLAEPAVVLVDEIDLHMHPRWQRQLIGYLTERLPNTQFIVTAHSPLVVQAAADANIVLLRREGDHVVIDNDPEILRNWRVDQILTSELFGVESARPPQIEAQLKERRALLAKSKPTRAEERRVQELEAEIGDLPGGENAEDRRAMELIRRAAEKLKSSP